MVNKLTITMPEMNLTLEAADSGLIASLLEKLNLASMSNGSIGASAPAPAPAKRGRPALPRPAAEPAQPTPARRSPGRPARLLLADLTRLTKQVKQPTSHEQRLLLYALAVRQKGLSSFTREEVQAMAEVLSVAESTVPGSLAKLKSQGFIDASRDGRTAVYSITPRGVQQAENILAGVVSAGRRGRQPSARPDAPATAPVTATPARRGRKPAAAASALPMFMHPSPMADRRRRAPGAPPQPRPATTKADLNPAEIEKADALVAARLNGNAEIIKSLKTAKDRILWLLQSLGSAAGSGINAKVISFVLQERFGITTPANAVGATLTKSLQGGLVSTNDANEFSITMNGRKYVDELLPREAQ